MTTTSASLKVGDRVHVEFDGVVMKLPYNPIFDYVEVRNGYDDILLAQRHVTKLPDPVPVWKDGDILQWVNSCTLFRVRGEWLCVSPKGEMSSHWAAVVNEMWRKGVVQRLVPEAQK